MKVEKCYKIVDAVPRGLRFLFHGVDGTKLIPFDTWLTAEVKWAGEGGNKYWTGFHVLKTREDCEKYMERFTDKKKIRTIVECRAKELRPKKSSGGLVFLASKLMIPKQSYKITLSDLYGRFGNKS